MQPTRKNPNESSTTTRAGVLERWLLVGLAAGLVACGGSDPGRPELMVYAAASLRDVAADFAAEFERRHGARVIYNFAGSNTLAQQIRAAPGADVFLSADESWIDVLDRAGRTAGVRSGFLTNRLVLIAHRDAELEIEHPRELAGIFSANGGRRGEVRFLALADPEAVPAGRYARAALAAIRLEVALDDDGETDLWDALVAHVAPTLDVRAALALVESDTRIVGVVYATDAATSDRVRVLHELAAAGGPPIRYGAVVVAGGEATELGRRFVAFLATPAAREIAERHGFGVPPAAGRVR